jgi:hypothetical protein
MMAGWRPGSRVGAPEAVVPSTGALEGEPDAGGDGVAAGDEVDGGVAVPVAVADGVCVGIGVGIEVGAGVGNGVGAEVGRGVGTGVGVGLGDGVGIGLGIGVGVAPVGRATLNTTDSVGNVPEPHFGSPLDPGLSKACPVQLDAPATPGVPVIRKTAESAAGSPTSGFVSVGFLNVTRVAPVIGPRSACQPCTDACVWPLTDTTATALMAKDVGTSIWTHVISSPPPDPPMFWTVSVTATWVPTDAVSGDPVSVHRRAARATWGTTPTRMAAASGATRNQR